jgi:hypothetical protein
VACWTLLIADLGKDSEILELATKCRGGFAGRRCLAGEIRKYVNGETPGSKIQKIFFELEQN